MRWKIPLFASVSNRVPPRNIAWIETTGAVLIDFVIRRIPLEKMCFSTAEVTDCA